MRTKYQQPLTSARFAPPPRQNRGLNGCVSRQQLFYRRDRPDMYGACSKTRRVRRKSMAAKTKFRGSFTALVTPFKNGALDEAAFRSLVNWQVSEGTNGLVPVGTTGESPTLSHDEHKKVVEWCIGE